MLADNKYCGRRSIRLNGYDYSQDGIYFITLCCKNRECLFGEIVDKKVVLNDFGKIAQKELRNSSRIRENMNIDCFIVMPNHVHAIVVIENNDCSVGAYGYTPDIGHAGVCGGGDRAYGGGDRAYGNTPLRGKFQSPSRNLGAMVRGYKSTVTQQINALRDTPFWPVWQRNYYEHIIRDEKSYIALCEYILSNPSVWEEDVHFLE